MGATVITEEDIQRAMELYESGYTHKDIGQVLHCAPTTIGRHLRAKGVKARPRQVRLRNRGSVLSEEEIARTRFVLERMKLTQREAAKVLGISVGTLNYRKDRFNIRGQTLSEAQIRRHKRDPVRDDGRGSSSARGGRNQARHK